MAKLFSKTLTRLIAHSHRSSSTTSNLSAAPLSSLPNQSSSRKTSDIAASLEPQSSSSPTEKENKGGSKGSTILWLLAALTSCTLADWHKNKQQREIRSIREYKKKCLDMEPMKLDTKNIPRGKDLDMLEFRRVIFKGVFDEQRSIYVGPKDRYMFGEVAVNGFNVITPLLPIPNDPNSIESPVLVNRGWVPLRWNEESPESPKTDDQVKRAKHLSNRLWKFWSKPEEQVISEVIPVEVVGVIRKSESPDISISPNDPSSSKWFYVEVPAMARAMGLDENTIYVEKTHKKLDHTGTLCYPVPKDDEALIHSKDVPMDRYSLAGYLLSLAFLSKSSKNFMRNIAPLMREK